MIIGYQIEVQNNYIKQNVCDKIVTEIPDFKGEMLVKKLKEAVVINWNGLYKHKPDSGENLKVDWIDSLTYKRVAAPKKPAVFQGHWIFVADLTIGDYHLRLFQADKCKTLDSYFAKIVAHPVTRDGQFDEATIVGQTELTLEQVFKMFFRSVSDEQLISMDISDVYD